jgi:predicted alpha/beta-fold hydrolase
VPRQVYRAVEKSDAVHLAVEPSGGHMGFVSQNPTEHGDRRWMDLAVLRWCLSILKRDV